MLLVLVANVVRNNATTSGIEVRIDYGQADTLVTPPTIVHLIERQMPNILSIRVKEVKTKTIESYVNQNPYMVNASASVSLLGKVVVRAEQRQPIVRVFCGQQEFYIDQEGITIPTSNEGESDVIVASGHLRHTMPEHIAGINLADWATDSTRSHLDIVRVWTVARHLYSNPGLRNQYDQIYIDPAGDIHLIPHDESYEINLGDINDLAKKFRHIETFKTSVLPVKGHDFYSQLSLKYKGQIVCRKRDNK